MNKSVPYAAGALLALAAAGWAGAQPEPVRVGTPVAWGVSTAYQGVPTDQRFLQVATGWAHTVALLPDGSIAVYGIDSHAGGQNHSEKPAGHDFVAIAAGQFHSLAIRADGTAIAWGGGDIWGSKGQTEIPLDERVSPPRPYTFKQVDGGELFSVGVTTSGEIVGWGGDYCPWDPTDVPVAPPGVEYLAVSTSGHHVLALRSDGVLDGWGIDVRQPPVGCAGYQRNQSTYPFEAPVVKFSAGHAFSFTLDDEGRLRAWGLVSEGPPPIDKFGEVVRAPVGERFAAVFGGYYHATAIRPNGRMVAWGKNNFGQASPPQDVVVGDLSSKYDHGVALRGCYADFDGNQTLDFFDFLAFVNAFAADDSAVDCDDDGTLSFFDLLCFQEAFSVGCEW
jgi:alpha-tubulin suppressor-like RCC1 family protein